MRNRILITLGLLVAIPFLLSACASTPRSQDELVGDWLQKIGTNNLVWQFKADGTLHVVMQGGGTRRDGLYRHLGGNRVALDFGVEMSSIVNLAVLGNQLMMTNPKGEVTALMRVNSDSKPAPAPKPQPAPTATNQPAPKAVAEPMPAPKPVPQTNSAPKPESDVGRGPL